MGKEQQKNHNKNSSQQKSPNAEKKATQTLAKNEPNDSKKSKPITKSSGQNVQNPNQQKNVKTGQSSFNKNSNKESVSDNNKKVEVDDRFAKASYDPRFLRPKKQITKVKIDSRFSKMLTDPAFQNFTKVDKYGRKVNLNENDKKKENEELKEYYDVQGQEQEIEDDEQVMQAEDDDDVDMEDQGQVDQNEGDDQQANQQDQEQEQQPANIRKWMQEYDQESSSLADMPVQQLIEQQQKDMPQVWSDQQENVIKNETVKATKRLALCNYDWMNISSKDLMILFNSFKSSSGFIKSIKVYQSIFGKEQMEQEETFGPQGIWNDEEEQDQFGEEQEKKGGNKWRKSWKELLRREDSSALDNAKLRAYEKERLKYFYAVIECDTKKTADQIYKECDGNQFQNSNLTFDLRFIPDDISFDKNMLKEECNEMPVTGEVKNFINRAMGHSKVELTWEDPELSLPATLKKKNWGKMTEEQLDKIDWGTYLNEEDVEEDQQKKLLFLEKDEDEVIPDWKKECNKKYRGKEKGDKLVISFDSGFAPAKPIKKAQADQGALSLKKQKKSKKELRMRAEQERNKRRSQLALMTQNNEEQRQKNFKPDLQDERFKAVYNNPMFSIDPSNPKFDHRKAGNVFKEVVKRNKDKHLE